MVFFFYNGDKAPQILLEKFNTNTKTGLWQKLKWGLKFLKEIVGETSQSWENVKHVPQSKFFA